MTAWSVFGQVLPAGTGTTSEVSANDIGIQYKITQPGFAQDGYWFYAPAGGDTNGAHYSFRLYSTANGTSGALIAGSAATGSGTWTAAAWNFTPLPPVPVINGTTYVAVATFGAGILYAYEHFYWSAGAGAAGISNGPVTAPSAAAALGNAQQPFTLPSAGSMPTSVFDASFYGFDIDIVPASRLLMASFP